MGEDFRGRVAIVSPHLDDAVLSLGTAIQRASRAGATMSVVTVLAGDPSSNDEVGEWDRLAGFRSAGEAAAARAKEDDRACEVVGARPTRLPFWDRRYARGAGQDEVYRSVVDSTSGASGLSNAVVRLVDSRCADRDRVAPRRNGGERPAEFPSRSRCKPSL